MAADLARFIQAVVAFPRASQSISVYAGKIRNAWPLILRD